MINNYREFFAASAGASAAFIGLLFVALTFIDNQSVSERTKAWRRIIANSAFSQLVNIFFVSMSGILPDLRNALFLGCVMAIFGLLISFRLLPATVNHSKTGRTSLSTLGLITVGAYILELVTGFIMLHNHITQSLLNYFVLSLSILYAGALARAWEITGNKRR